MAKKKTAAIGSVGSIAFTIPNVRELVTIGERDKLWKTEGANRHKVVIAAKSFVRVIPPPDASDEAVERVRAACEAAGAERVFVMPRRRADVVSANAVERASAARVSDVRTVVTRLVEESSFGDKAALQKRLEEIMAGAGL